tara:strand:+ start:1787 stop:2596 length:810 start_codon:yes stop_codon:yes gene_type:complete
MNKTHIYKSYLDESIDTISKIYEELLKYSYLSSSQSSQTQSLSQDSRDIKESEQSIVSLCTVLDRRTRVVGNYLSDNPVIQMDYEIDKTTWKQQMYLEIKDITFIHIKFDVLFLVDTPEESKYTVVVKDFGVAFQVTFDETNDDVVRIITLAKGLRLIFNEALIDEIRESGDTQGYIHVYTSPFFVDNLLRVRIPFHPNRLYLTNIGWIRHALDGLDLLVSQLKYCYLQYYNSQHHSIETSNGGGSSVLDPFVSYAYTPLQTSTSFLYN